MLATARKCTALGGDVKSLQYALGVAGILVAGYFLVAALPDIRRYIRISRM